MKVTRVFRVGRQTTIAVGSFVAGGAIMVAATAFATSGGPTEETPSATSTTLATRVAQPDCTRAPFRGANYEGCDLRGATFDRAELTNASFRNANLDGAYFHDLTLQQVDFTGASLIGTRFEGVNFISSHFEGSSIARATVGGGSGDGLSTGLPAWDLPHQISVTTDNGQFDLSRDVTGVAPIVMKRPTTPMCKIPLVGDGYTTNPVHLTDCPSDAVQWHWDFIWGGDESLDSLAVFNLSHDEQTAHMPMVVQDGFGRRRTVDVVVTVGDITEFDKGSEPGEYWVYGY